MATYSKFQSTSFAKIFPGFHSYRISLWLTKS
jgi:predicted  nucleic acid-binding Zn-ribbon protein